MNEPLQKLIEDMLESGGFTCMEKASYRKRWEEINEEIEEYRSGPYLYLSPEEEKV